MLRIDFSLASFPITRDFLFVLIKRFHSDSFVLVFSEEHQVSMARSIGLQADIVHGGQEDDFQKILEQKNIVAHNLSAWGYFLYELRR